MITQDEAEQIAERVMRASTTEWDDGWELKEFEEGWLIIKKTTVRLMGAPCHVVERDSGRVVTFPSVIAPGRILTEYAEVAAKGFEEPRLQTGD